MTEENTDDDAWLAQLRSALVAPPADDPEPPSGHNGTMPVDRVDGPEAAPPPTTPVFADDEPIPDPSGLGAVRDDLRALGSRLASVELIVEDIAHVVRRASAGPGPGDLEQMIVRLLRAELSKLLEEHVASLPTAATPATVALEDETLDRWAHRAERGEVPSADVVILANELRTRISDLEDLQRRAFAQLTADRKVLIDDAVREIRTLLFGQ